MATPVVSFIVVNFNGGDLLQRCLSSLQAQTFTEHEVIVVDNGSHDGSCDAAQTSFPTVCFQRHAENLGFAAANNRALDVARGRYVALVNNDAYLDPEWAAAMVGALDAHPDAGAAAGLTLQARDAQRVDAAGFAYYACGSADTWKNADARALATPEHAPFGPNAAAAMYRRSTLDAVGPFHAEYFCYHEDTDLAVRLVLWGHTTVYVPQAVAHHLGSHTGKDRSDFHVYHLRRNIEYLYWVDMVGYLAWVGLPLHLAYETLALAGAAMSGQLDVVLRAKRDAFKTRDFISRERRKLKASLDAQGMTRAAQRAFVRKARFGLPLNVRLSELLHRRSHGR
jgi:GT2 family glycosyltransferase